MTSEPVLANKMLSEAEMGIPKTLVCCVCGQRLGVTSLRIHYPVCIKKFDDREVLRE